MTWKCFLHYCPFVGRIHQSPVDSSHKGSVMLSFDVLCAVSLKKILKKQWSCLWIKTLSLMFMWRHCNEQSLQLLLFTQYIVLTTSKILTIDISTGTVISNLTQIYLLNDCASLSWWSLECVFLHFQSENVNAVQSSPRRRQVDAIPGKLGVHTSYE